MMKRFVLLLTVLTLALGCASAASVTPVDLTDVSGLATPSDLMPDTDVLTLIGTVTALEDDSFLMLTDEGVLLQVNVDDDTLWPGQETVSVGDVVTVAYNGMMTRSIPGQIYGQAVNCFTLTGTVSELLAGGFLLTDEEGVVIEVRAEDALLAGLRPDQHITVFFNGVMTASLPGQVNALHIRLPELMGRVDSISEDSFILTDGEGVQWQVNIGEATQQWTELTVGEPVRVCWDGTAAFSLPAQIFACEVLPVQSAE